MVPDPESRDAFSAQNTVMAGPQESFKRIRPQHRDAPPANRQLVPCYAQVNAVQRVASSQFRPFRTRAR